MLLVAVVSQVVHKQHGVGEIGQGKARVGGREFLVNDGAGHSVQSSASVIFRGADAQQAQFAHAAKQFEIELLGPVVFQGLRFDVLLRPLSNHLTKHQVLFAGVGDVHVGHADASSRWLLTFGADTAHSLSNPLESKRQILSFNQKFKGQIEQAFTVDNSIPSAMPVAFQRHKFVVNVQ